MKISLIMLLMMAVSFSHSMRSMDTRHLRLSTSLAGRTANSLTQAMNNNRSLLKAAEHNWTVITKNLVNAGADVNYQEQSCGYTPLLWATENGNKDLVRSLLEHNADTSKQERSGMTALHRAAVKGHDEIAKLLIDYHADVNARCNAHGCETPLKCALYFKHSSTTELLIDSGAYVNDESPACSSDSPLELAIKKHLPGMVQKLIDNGARLYHGLRSCGEEPESPLFTALEKGTPEIVKIVITHDPTAINKSKPSGHACYPLVYAAAQGNYEVVKILLEHGANVNAQNNLYGSALFQAVAKRNIPLLTLLLAQPTLNIHARGNSCSPESYNQRDVYNVTVLECCAALGTPEIFELLLSQGATITNNLLICAVNGCNWNMFTYFINKQCTKTQYAAALIKAHDLLSNELHENTGSTLKSMIKTLLTLDACSAYPEKFAYCLLFKLARTYKNESLKDILNSVITQYLRYNPSDEVLKHALATLHDTAWAMVFCHQHDTQPRTNLTVFDLAAAQGKKDLVELFLHLGAPCNETYQQINARNKLPDDTPLHLAIQHGHLPIVQMLITSGADPELASKEHGYSSLHAAATHNHISIVDFLLQHYQAPCCINTLDGADHTPLYYSCINVNSEMAQKLLTAGADKKLLPKKIFFELFETWLDSLTFNNRVYQLYRNTQNIYDIFALLLPTLSPHHQIREECFSLLHCIAGLDRLINQQTDYDTQGNRRSTSYRVDPVRRELATLLLRHGARIDLKLKASTALDAPLLHATPPHVAALCKDQDLLMLLLAKSYIPLDTECAQPSTVDHEDNNIIEDEAALPRTSALQDLVTKTITRHLRHQTTYTATMIKRFNTITAQAQELIIKNFVHQLSLEEQQRLAHTLQAQELFAKLNAQRHLDLVYTIVKTKTMSNNNEECDAFKNSIIDITTLKNAVDQHFREIFLHRNSSR